MSVQMIELEEVMMVEVSDDALEASGAGGSIATVNGTWTCFPEVGCS